VSDGGMTLQVLGGVNLPCGWYPIRGQLPSTGGREHTHTHTHTYLSYKLFIYFLIIHFHNCLSNVWRAFEPHRESQVLVFTKRCDDGTGVLTFVVKLKCIVLHTIVKFSEKLYPEHLRKTSVIVGNGYCLRFMTLFS
jgi:hypothetical protein